MFADIAAGTRLVTQSLQAFARFPSLLLPLAFLWGVATPALAYLLFRLSWWDYGWTLLALIAVGLFMLFSLLLSLSCFVLLERIRQIEMDEPRDMARALTAGLRNTGRALPIVVVWTLLWVVLQVIGIVAGGDDDSGDDDSLASWSLQALAKGLRMVVFLTFPALAWDGIGPVQATKRGLDVARTHKAVFATGFVLTKIVATLVIVPPIALLLGTVALDWMIPTWAWVATIAYCALVWSFAMVLEQMFAAELYAWHLVWEDARAKAGTNGAPAPSVLQDIKRPSLVDGVPDLVHVGQA
jgi:hypothetical protein